jgi:hypothetical protein
MGGWRGLGRRFSGLSILAMVAIGRFRVEIICLDVPFP